ncbi:MAG: LppM family (lipo)protein [Actinomycetota bacterium]
MNMRVARRLLTLGAMALLLAGCFKVNMDVEVSPENTVSGSAIIAVDEGLIELSGQSADQLFEDMNLSDLPAGAQVEPYEEDGFIGQRITFDEVSLEDFRGENTLSGGAAGEELDIVRRGDEFVVSGAIDMSGQEFTGTEIPEEFMDNFEFRVSITFPGEVKSATGEIDGNTVTWEPTIGENTRVEAVASAIPSESPPLLMILLIAAGALVLGAVVYLLTHRKTPLPVAGPVGDATTTPIEAMPPMPGGPSDPVAPVEPPPNADGPVSPVEPTSPAEPVRPVDPVPDPPEAPGAAVPPEDEPPPPSASV